MFETYIAMSSIALSKLKKRKIIEVSEKRKKKIERFDGLTEEEVQKYTLPDILKKDLDMVFVGINPSLTAAYRGRYYAGPGNHFYKLLYESGLTSKCLSFDEDYKLLQYQIGLTNIVTRATRSSADLKRTEIKAGAIVVEEKLKFFKPKIAIFNGKGIYEVFADKNSKSEFNFGLQPECIGHTAVWVVPSSSARCANFPRMSDKLHFYTALKKYLQYLKGEVKDIDVKEFYFDGKCKQPIPGTSRMWRRKNMSTFLHGGRVANKKTVSLDTSEESIAVIKNNEFVVKVCSIMDSNKDGKVVEDACKDMELVDNRMNICQNGPDNFEVQNGIEKKKDIIKKQRNHLTKAKDRKLLPVVLKNSSSAVQRQDSLDFVNLIKCRLLEKKERQENHVKGKNDDDDSSEESSSGHKSKFFDLISNS
ncbi:G/T mismatch-specific thymine DNA glycosylase [Orussus abietinus]|uniref:G/T mismatch-specific thymine DNA glycosylase n=1 Tax=Orussus abietinus TaxID=222816 RepID=UPI00062568F8|nr:G/T mismatch-specific thymine DNA glycosylase [Orussus abietinus]